MIYTRKVKIGEESFLCLREDGEVVCYVPILVRSGYPAEREEHIAQGKARRISDAFKLVSYIRKIAT